MAQRQTVGHRDRLCGIPALDVHPIERNKDSQPVQLLQPGHVEPPASGHVDAAMLRLFDELLSGKQTDLAERPRQPEQVKG